MHRDEVTYSRPQLISSRARVRMPGSRTGGSGTGQSDGGNSDVDFRPSPATHSLHALRQVTSHLGALSAKWLQSGEWAEGSREGLEGPHTGSCAWSALGEGQHEDPRVRLHLGAVWK